MVVFSSGRWRLPNSRATNRIASSNPATAKATSTSVQSAVPGCRAPRRLPPQLPSRMGEGSAMSLPLSNIPSQLEKRLGDAEVDDDSRHIDERRDERTGSDAGIDAEAFEHDWQHRADQRAPEADRRYSLGDYRRQPPATDRLVANLAAGRELVDVLCRKLFLVIARTFWQQDL